MDITLIADLSRIPLPFIGILRRFDCFLSRSIAITCLSLCIPPDPIIIFLTRGCLLPREREASLAKTLTPFGTSLVCPQGGFCGAGVFHRIHFRGRKPSPCSSEFCARNHPDETLMHFATFLHQFYLLRLVVSYSFSFTIREVTCLEKIL